MTKRMIRGLMLTILLLSFFRINYSQRQPIRTIRIKAAADQEFRGPNMWEFRIKRLISDASRRFEKAFGIKFELTRIEAWQSDMTLTSSLNILNELRREIPKEECDIVIGFYSRPQKSLPGVAHYFSGYALIPDHQFEEKMKKILGHELSHLFGAVDLDEKRSIMNGKSPSYQFDEFTNRLISLNKERTFNPHVFPLPQNKLGDVIEVFKQREASHPGEYDVNRCLAILFLEKKDYQTAYLECQKALEANPQSKEIHNILGIIHSNNLDPNSAISEYHQSFLPHPNVPETHLNLGIAYENKGRLEEALKEYNKAIELNPDYAVAHSNMANIYLKMGKTEAAEEKSRKAISLNPESAEAHCTLGAVLTCQNDLIQAEKETLRALNINPGMPEAHNNLAVIYLEFGWINESILEYKKAIHLYPGYARAYANLGYAYFLKGRLNDAASEYRKALKIDPQCRNDYLELEKLLDPEIEAGFTVAIIKTPLL